MEIRASVFAYPCIASIPLAPRHNDLQTVRNLCCLDLKPCVQPGVQSGAINTAVGLEAHALHNDGLFVPDSPRRLVDGTLLQKLYEIGNWHSSLRCRVAITYRN